MSLRRWYRMNREQLPITLLVLSFWIWCVLLSFQFLANDWESGSPMMGYQAIGLLQFVVVAMLLRAGKLRHVLAVYDPLQLAILLVIALSLVLQLHGEPAHILVGIAYTLTLVAAIVLLSTMWTLDQDARTVALGGASAIFLAFFLAALAMFGPPEGRRLGGIHPNHVGQVMVSCFIFAQFCRHRAVPLLQIVSIVAAASVNSRHAVVGCVIAFLVFEMTFRPLSARLPILAATAVLGILVAPDVLVSVLALDDPSRNVASGFTGREDLWGVALQAIADDPFGLGFKRPDWEEAGHNGYLKAVLEFGVPGGGTIIAAVIASVILAIVRAAQGGGEPQRRFASARAAGLSALAFATFFEPQMFNLGDVHGISFLLLLFAPGPTAAGQGLRPVPQALAQQPLRRPAGAGARVATPS